MASTELSVRAPRGLARRFEPDTLIAEWRAEMQERADAGEISANTVTTYYRGMTKFWTWFGDQQTYKSVGAKALRSWMGSMKDAGNSVSTRNTLYSGVRAFFTWAVAEAGLAYNPTAGVPGAKAGRRRHKRAALTDDEVMRVLAQPDVATDTGKRAKVILCFMAYTGLRTIEVQRAKIGDLDQGNGKLKLWIRGKGHEDADEKVYAVNAELLDALYAWLKVHPSAEDLEAALFCSLAGANKGGSLHVRTIRGLVKAAYRGAGIRDPRKTTHSLRHSLVTNLIRHKVAPTKIMTVTRHRSLDTLLAYAHEMARDDDPAEAYVDYSNGPPDEGAT